jgi:hypothetical protein
MCWVLSSTFLREPVTLLGFRGGSSPANSALLRSFPLDALCALLDHIDQIESTSQNNTRRPNRIQLLLHLELVTTSPYGTLERQMEALCRVEIPSRT